MIRCKTMTKRQYKVLSEQLRDVIRCCEVSHNEISRQTGIDKSVISRFLHGKQGLSQASIDALSSFFRLRLVAEHDVKKG